MVILKAVLQQENTSQGQNVMYLCYSRWFHMLGLALVYKQSNSQQHIILNRIRN